MNRVLFVLSLAGLMASCGNDGNGSEDERTPPGRGSPAARYCANLGHRLEPDERCGFPDGSSCDQWAFFRGQCGAAFTRCARAGGVVRSETVVFGAAFGIVAICDLPSGQSCRESEFVASGRCG